MILLIIFGILGYIALGFLTLMVEKLYEVVNNDDSSNWKLVEGDGGIVIFWPFFIVFSLFYFIGKFFIWLFMQAYKPFIAVAETIRCTVKLRKEVELEAKGISKTSTEEAKEKRAGNDGAFITLRQ